MSFSYTIPAMKLNWFAFLRAFYRRSSSQTKPTVECFFNFMDNWKDIPWYEWLYQINWLTNEIKSLSYGKTKRPKILKLDIKEYGHIKTCLYKNKKRWNCWFHQIVMLIKEWPCPEWLEVCHNDWNPQNNNPDNLRYDTRRNNVVDTVKMWRCNFIWHTRWARRIVQYKKSWEIVKVWNSQMEIHRALWISQWNIWYCCSWKRNVAWWFIWKYE